LIQMLPLQSVYVTQFFFESSAPGLLTWYCAGTASVAPSFG
jgi:hypothetical protein